MTTFRVFVTRQLPADLSALQQVADVEVWPERQPPSDAVLQAKIGSLDGLLCLLTDPIDQALIKAGPSLKVISQMAVGYDNIDIAAATARKIPVGHTPGVLTDATADLTWALLMAAARQVVAGDRFTRSGQWQTWEPALLLGPDVAGATLGIIGFGRIGQAVAKRALGFGMRILYHGRHRVAPELEEALNAGWVTLETLLQTSDFVTLHTPLTAATQHLINKDTLGQMKPSAMLINTARGPIIDSTALYDALSTGQIAGAAIDVTDPEPIKMDSPLLTLDNLIITPHIGSASQQTRETMAKIAIANLITGLKGEPLPHCVNPEVYH
ncbi:MAG: D-glycerate dehydrogenase [Cyanobacteria bacterium J06635_1]